MDSSHIALCALSLNVTGFESFRCDRDLVLGMSFIHLSKILSCAGNEDTILIRSVDEPDIVSFIFHSTITEKISHFELNLLNIQSENLNVPDIAFDCQVRMSSKEFRTIMVDLAAFGDNCMIHMTHDCVKFSVSGDMGHANVSIQRNNLGHDQNKWCEIEMNNAISLNFTIRYLLNFTKATSLSDRVHLSMSMGHPLVVEYMMEETGSLKYYLAPKLDDP